MRVERENAGRGSAARWVAGAVALVVLPKCLLCLASYVAAGAAGLELCGVTATDGATEGLAQTIGIAAVALASGAWLSRRRAGGRRDDG